MKQIEGIWLPDSDDHFQAHLQANPLYEGRGTYQFKKVEAALRVVSSDRRGVAVDVGAHVGLWSRVLAHEFAKVLAIEPVPAHLECLRRNVADLDNVEILEAAVTDRNNSTVDIILEGGNTGNSRVCDLNQTMLPGTRTLPCMAIALDALQLEAVDLLKVDVEGYEIYVLQGAETTIKKHKPVVVVEQKQAAYGNDRLAAVKLLQSWGAEVLWEKAGDVCLGWD